MSKVKPEVLQITTDYSDGGIVVTHGNRNLAVNLKPGQELQIEIDGVTVYVLSRGAKEVA